MNKLLRGLSKPRVFMPKHSSTERVIYLILLFLRLVILIITLWALNTGDWEIFFISILALLLTFSSELIESTYKIEIPVEYDLVLVGFIFLSVFVGEAFDAYEKFFWWDAMLHTASGVVLGFAGFLLLYTLYKQKSLNISAKLLAFITFSFGMTFGAVWEIFEFTIDGVFDTKMQKNGLTDTMWDLIVDALGSLIVSVMAYRTIRDGSKSSLLRSWLDKFFDANPSLRIGEDRH